MANEPNEPQEYPFFEQLEQRLLLSTGGTAALAEQLFAGLTTTGSIAPAYVARQPLADADDGVTPSTVESVPLINMDDFRADERFAGIDGSGFAVVVLDGGIDLDHPFFGPDLDSDGIADRIVYQWDFADGDDDASDVDGHGSNVTSIVAGSPDPAFPTYPGGMATGADIIHLKVFEDAGDGYFSYIESALQWVVANAATYNIASVNMSLSDGGKYTTPETLYGLGDELVALGAMDVVVASASGNSYYHRAKKRMVQGVAYPSADPNSLSIGAVYDADTGGWQYSDGAKAYSTGPDRITPFSQRDDELTTVMAPGAPITGADENGGVVAYHGTSQASPHVAGIAAVAQQLAVQQLGQRLTTTEFDNLLGSTGVTINDGDDEDDNAKNTGLDFPRVDMLALGNAILAMMGDPPSFTSTPVTDATEDALYSYSVTADDPDVGDTLTITGPTLPGWLTLTDNGDGTATLSGTPLNEHVGGNPVTLRVSDGTATADQSFTITVANTNDEPSFTSTPVTDATEDALYSYSVTADDPDVGDSVTITAPTLPGWLTLTDNGDGTATLSGTPLNEHVGGNAVTLRVTDAAEATDDQSFTVTVDPAPAEVVGRHIFYNNSSFDGNDAAANANDDNAIAPDKAALLPGGTATFANYTSYSRGINGVIVDIDGLAGTPAAADFEFKVGNDDDPGSWADAPDPVSITVRQGEGDGGSDRVTIVWADNAIAKEWLQVTVLATDNTGLAEADVFYFGNAVGDTGNSAANVYVNAFDTGGVRDHPRGFLDPAPIDDVYDFNRDQRVNAFDFGTARDNATGFLNALRLITMPAATGGMMMAGGSGGSGGGNGQSPGLSVVSMPEQGSSDPIEVLAAAAGTPTVYEDRFDLLGSAVQPLGAAEAQTTSVAINEQADGAADAAQLLASAALVQPLTHGDADAENVFVTSIALESAGAAAADDAATGGDTDLADPLVDVLADSQLTMPLRN